MYADFRLKRIFFLLSRFSAVAPAIDSVQPAQTHWQGNKREAEHTNRTTRMGLFYSALHLNLKSITICKAV